MTKLLNFFFCILSIVLSFSSALTYSEEPITPLTKNLKINQAKAELGKKLFFDKRLSYDNTISCSSCHNLAEGGAETNAVSTGVNGFKGERNSPTVYNSSLNFTQTWDGRASTLTEQVLLPILKPTEMGMKSLDELVNKLNKITEYKDSFKTIYNKPINDKNIADAIAEFEKTLITLNSPFDQYLAGDKSALSEQQHKGYRLFKAYGCVSCHQGRNVGGNMFQKFGVLQDINLQNGSLNKDLGRYTVTGNEWDKHVFKVPSLRLAVLTPPYFHDGSVATIEEAVDIMIKFQLGRSVPEQNRNDIISFLKSLVGEFPKGIK